MASTPDRADAPAEGVARLAVSQLRRMRRIVDSAVELAEEGGFDAVRLRDVAEASGVSLGTLYKYFRSKEDVLLFAVNEAARGFEEAIASRPPQGESPAERLAEFFSRATRPFVRRPNFARATMRSIGSGDDTTAVQQAGYHMRMSRLIVAALRGEAPRTDLPLDEPYGTERERQIALVLYHVWFASLIGWTNGLHPVKTVLERMDIASRLLVPGT